MFVWMQLCAVLILIFRFVKTQIKVSMCEIFIIGSIFIISGRAGRRLLPCEPGLGLKFPAPADLYCYSFHKYTSKLRNWLGQGMETTLVNRKPLYSSMKKPGNVGVCWVSLRYLHFQNFDMKVINSNKFVVLFKRGHIPLKEPKKIKIDAHV